MTNQDEETLNHIKEIEYMILKDFIEICDNNNIEY
jgi:phosphorylcholine metabolism protein LicD